MARTRLVAGNWKMHGSRETIGALLDAIVAGVDAAGAQCAVCPPFPYLAQVAERLRGTPVAWAAQNVAEQAQEVHAFLRERLPEEMRRSTPILYGGSVKPQNAAAIFAMPDVDGGLIGGASLVAADFLAILRAAAGAKR